MFKDITGYRFGKLQVLWPAGYKQWGKRNRIFWLCQCDCGSFYVAFSSNLRHGTRSCGCLYKDMIEKRKTHAMSRTPEYEAYKQAKQRCVNKRSKDYPYYGGRGIKFKFLSFEDFFAHLGKRPSNQYSIDRIDNDGNYEVGNVRWAVKTVQMNNRRLPHNAMTSYPL